MRVHPKKPAEGMSFPTQQQKGSCSGKATVRCLNFRAQTHEAEATHPRFNGENLEKNKVFFFYNKLANLAAKLSCTAPQLALSWLLHQGSGIVPIPGTTKVKNLDINIGSVNVKLNEANFREISDAVPIDEVEGG